VTGSIPVARRLGPSVRRTVAVAVGWRKKVYSSGTSVAHGNAHGSQAFGGSQVAEDLGGRTRNGRTRPEPGSMASIPWPTAARIGSLVNHRADAAYRTQWRPRPIPHGACRAPSASRSPRLPLLVAPAGPRHEKLGVGAVGPNGPQGHPYGIGFHSREQDPVALSPDPDGQPHLRCGLPCGLWPQQRRNPSGSERGCGAVRSYKRVSSPPQGPTSARLHLSNVLGLSL
jgi:hypothetical protein